jgi:outer membrane protein OmpA-like peptidoglycan-associated protein
MSAARVWLRLIPLALLVTAALAGVATWATSGDIGADLATRSQSALAAAGLSGGQVGFSGRDATLQGFPADKAQQAADIVRGVDGVREVTVSPATGRPAAAPPSVPVTPPSVPTTTPAPTTTSTPPPPAAQTKTELQKQIDEVLADAPITFDPNTADLTPVGTESAKRVADLVANAEVTPRLTIGGHVAEGPGGERAALKLSQDRAKAVAKLLTADGVEAKLITAKGYGDTRPSSDDGEDRRVEITVR